MEIKPQPRLHFDGVDIFNVQFQSKTPYRPEQEIKLTIDPKVYYPKGEPNAFRILMTVLMECPSAFHLSVTGVGYFTLSTEAEEELRTGFIHSNAPAVLFPYLRSFITTLTANLGTVTGALTIPPHFFNGHLEEIQENQI